MQLCPDLSDYYKVNGLFQFVDHVLQEVDSRFSQRWQWALTMSIEYWVQPWSNWNSQILYIGGMSVAYRSTCRPTIGQSLSVDISANISVECRWTYRPICRPTHLGRHIDRLSTDISVDMSTDMSTDTSVEYRSRGAQNTHDPITLAQSSLTFLVPYRFAICSFNTKYEPYISYLHVQCSYISICENH